MSCVAAITLIVVLSTAYVDPKAKGARDIYRLVPAMLLVVE
jgi:hypothetical protein